MTQEPAMISFDKYLPLLHRDNFTCRYCGVTGRDARLCLDHKIPRSRGGKTTEDNLITSCWDCNQTKRDNLWCEKELAEISAEVIDFESVAHNIHQSIPEVKKLNGMQVRSMAASDSTWYRLKRYALDNGLTLEKALDKLLDTKTEKN